MKRVVDHLMKLMAIASCSRRSLIDRVYVDHGHLWKDLEIAIEVDR